MTDLVAVSPGEHVGWDIRVYRAPHPLDPRTLQRPYDSAQALLGDGPSGGIRSIDMDQIHATESRLRSLGHAELLARGALSPMPMESGGSGTMTSVQYAFDLTSAPRSPGQPPYLNVTQAIDDDRVSVSFGWVADPGDSESTPVSASSTTFPPLSVGAQLQTSRFDSGPGGWWYITIAEPIITHSTPPR